MKNQLRTNPKADLNFKSGAGADAQIDMKQVEGAVLDCHRVIDLIVKDIPIDLFAILGLRNLSAFVGELYAKSLERVCNGLLRSNPHQDGYPDLLLMDGKGIALWKQIEEGGQLQAKAPFSPFENGGIEVKSTCGSVPTPAECAKRGLLRPGLGDTRIDVMKGYDWKAHHQQTNNLLGLLWDFDNHRVPRIKAVFFGNSLSGDDWGSIVAPKKGGGRTTSVSIMPRRGVKKMYGNWLVVDGDPRYGAFFNRRNKGSLM